MVQRQVIGIPANSDIFPGIMGFSPGGRRTRMSFFEELKRRNVVRVGIAYVVLAWVLAQVADLVLDAFEAPSWVMQVVLILIALGLPVALLLAWAYELTPDGVKREADVERGDSITKQTGRRLDRLTIGVLGVAVALLLVDRFVLQQRASDVEVDTTSARQSIAVLPFANMSDDSDHFADGLSEELLNLLAKMPDLKVTGRTSSFSFKGRNEDLREIGEALGVEHVLEGSVRRSGDRLRITAQLIKVDDGFHLWSETYDRQMADIFDIQDDVSRAITNALQLHLAPAADRPTDNSEAFAIYLEALATVADVSDGDVSQVIALLDRAIAIDPQFAAAYELKGLAYWLAGGWTIPSPEAQQLTYAAASAALEIDPELPGARSLAISAHPTDWTWVGEFEAQEAALEQMPNNLSLLDTLAFNYISTGYFREGLAMAERMIANDPLSALGYMRKGAALAALGRRQDEAEARRRSIELGNDAMKIVGAQRSIVAGQPEAALEWLKDSQIFFGFEDDPAAFLQNASDPESGREFLKGWIERVAESATDFETAQFAYIWYAVFGHFDEYFERIRALSDAADNVVWDNTGPLVFNGFVYRRSEFSAHPEFLPLMKRDTTTDLWDARGAPDFCSKDSGEWVCE